jgi:hypothetical protein
MTAIAANNASQAKKLNIENVLASTSIVSVEGPAREGARWQRK